jgi:hypothetical protein
MGRHLGRPTTWKSTKWHFSQSRHFDGRHFDGILKLGSQYRNVATGVDVMITIFGDFGQFSAEKWRFFSKANVMIKFLHNLVLFWVKIRQFFCWIFRRKYLKNHSIGSGFNGCWIYQNVALEVFAGRDFVANLLRNFSRDDVVSQGRLEMAETTLSRTNEYVGQYERPNQFHLCLHKANE